jgi:copper oxidase (laccase) domain-containing protein
MRALGAAHVRATLGPCIRPECYEFGAADLDAVAAQLGDHVRGTTSWGTPALDVPAAVRASLASVGVELVDASTCTACSPDHWSHRAAGDVERQAVVVWR